MKGDCMIERMTEAEIAELNVRRTNRDGTAEVLCTKASCEITALRAEVEWYKGHSARVQEVTATYTRTIMQYRAENEKLRAALKDCIEVLDDLKWSPGAVERARAALEEKQ